MEFARQPQWELTTVEMAALQRELAGEVVLEDPPGFDAARVERVAGVDAALGRFAGSGRAAVVVWRVADGGVLERHAIEAPLRVPYIPGLLAFREGPLVEQVLRLVREEPDILLFDGQGIAHPRGLGIAAHLGVLLDRPAVGVAKSRLFGRPPQPERPLGPAPGDRQPLLDPRGRPIGVVLRSRSGSRPVYVSPGHRVTPETAAAVVLRCLRGHRLPEPLHLADRLSKAKADGPRASG